MGSSTEVYADSVTSWDAITLILHAFQRSHVFPIAIIFLQLIDK